MRNAQSQNAPAFKMVHLLMKMETLPARLGHFDVPESPRAELIMSYNRVGMKLIKQHMCKLLGQVAGRYALPNLVLEGVLFVFFRSLIFCIRA